MDNIDKSEGVLHFRQNNASNVEANLPADVITVVNSWLRTEIGQIIYTVLM